MPDASAAAGKPAKGEKPVGKVEHYYPKAKAAAVGLTGDLKVGDDIHIVGHGDDVRVKVKSLQLDHAPIEAGHAGQHIGVGLARKVHEGDDVLIVRGSPKAPKAPKAPKKAASKPKAKPKRAKPSARKPKRAKAAARKPSKAKRGKKAAKRPRPKAVRRKAKRAKPSRR